MKTIEQVREFLITKRKRILPLAKTYHTARGEIGMIDDTLLFIDGELKDDINEND